MSKLKLSQRTNVNVLAGLDSVTYIITIFSYLQVGVLNLSESYCQNKNVNETGQNGTEEQLYPAQS